MTDDDAHLIRQSKGVTKALRICIHGIDVTIRTLLFCPVLLKHAEINKRSVASYQSTGPLDLQHIKTL